jgi:salicylate hydroxylase
MGQGGAMAIEDAISIATLLPRGTAPENIPTRLEMYQQSRRPRVELVLHFTRMNGRDENDVTGARVDGTSLIHSMRRLYLTIIAAEMVRFMGICFSHNEIEHSTKLLRGERS